MSVLVLAASGCVGGALPPSRTDVGSTVVAGRGGPAHGLRVTTGAHTASATTRGDVGLDVGGGYVFEELAPSAEGEHVARVDGPPTTGAPPAARRAHGGYLEVGRTLRQGDRNRIWLGVRSEILVPEDQPSGLHHTVAVRAAWEVYATGAGGGGFSDRCGGGAGYAHGQVGVGLYVDSGVRTGRGGESAIVATAGVTVRLPFVAGFAFSLCNGC